MKKSEVWNHFTKKNKDNAVCNICGHNIGCRGSSTTAMANHLSKKHSIPIKRTVENNPEKQISVEYRSSLLKFLKKVSLNAILSKCAAEDGLSIRQIKNSTAINEYVSFKGHKMPKSESTIMKLILQYHDEKRRELINFFESECLNGKRFSITVDEWCDRNIKRYLNVTVHCGQEPYVLGLVEIIGSCDALQLKSAVEEKLLEYGLNFNKHIVASTHDGASVMQKYGRNITSESQLCHNHGIHLSIIDVLYQKTVIILKKF